MKQVLVIGGSGFVGKAVVRAFQRRECVVLVLNHGSLLVPDTIQLTADRNDPVALCAAIGSLSFDAVIDTNCYHAGHAATLLDVIAQRSPRLLMISSAAVYADDAEQPPSESAKTGGATVWGAYGRDKFEAERIFVTRAAQFDSVTIVRPPYIFGPGNNLERERWFWSRQVNGIPVILPAGVEARIQFIHEDDLGDALCFLAERNTQGADIFNVADPQILTLSQACTLLAEAAGQTDTQIRAGHRFPTMSARSWFPFRDSPCLADFTKLYRAGWTPRASLRQRFGATFEVSVAEGRVTSPILTPFERSLIERAPF